MLREAACFPDLWALRPRSSLSPCEVSGKEREGSLLRSAWRSASNSSFPSNADLPFPGGAIAVTKTKPTSMVDEERRPVEFLDPSSRIYRRSRRKITRRECRNLRQVVNKLTVPPPRAGTLWFRPTTSSNFHFPILIAAARFCAMYLQCSSQCMPYEGRLPRRCIVLNQMILICMKNYNYVPNPLFLDC